MPAYIKKLSKEFETEFNEKALSQFLYEEYAEANRTFGYTYPQNWEELHGIRHLIWGQVATGVYNYILKVLLRMEASISDD